MNHVEQKTFLKEFQAYSKEVTATKESSQKFLVRSGINTPTGRLTRVYANTSIRQAKNSK